MMIRAHRPFTLTAGNIMLLSLDTFVQVHDLLKIFRKIFKVILIETLLD